MEKREPFFNKEISGEKAANIENIEPIDEKSDAETILEKNKLPEIIEKPLLEACEELYDKNVKTISSSANKKNIEDGEGYIIIDFASLSEENKEVARGYGDPYTHGEYKAVKISIPLDEFSTVENISEKAKEISSNFHKQEPVWIEAYTLEELKEAYKIPPGEEEFDHPETWEEEGYYYDSQNGLFYLSEDHYGKIREYKEKDKEV